MHIRIKTLNTGNNYKWGCDNSMEYKKKYKKRNDFKINFIFDNKGERIDKIIERAFQTYLLKKW